MGSDNIEINIKHLTFQHLPLFQKLLQLFHEVFEMGEEITVSDSYLSSLLAKPEFIALAAVDGDEVLGGLTAYVMPMYYKESAEAYLYDMAVGNAHQRKGIGKQLVGALIAYCKEHGISTAFVEAHEEDTHAVEFYLSTGGKAEKVVHFNYHIGE